MKKKKLSWARFLIESVVIVFSILLAFFIDTSWERVQQRDRERDYTLALQGEFIAAIPNDRPALALYRREVENVRESGNLV